MSEDRKPVGTWCGDGNVALNDHGLECALREAELKANPLMTLHVTPSELRVKRLHADAKLPTYATEGSSGLDVCALEDAHIPQGTVRKMPIGWAFEPPPGHELQVRPRSGLSSRGLDATLGTVDLDFRGEVHVILKAFHGDHDVKAGDRIAQLVIAPVTQAVVVEVDELSSTERDVGGFGSTGR